MLNTKHSFSKDYIRIYQHRDNAEAQLAIDNLLREINLPSGAMCLDLCCGFGRHLDHLNSLNIMTFGADLSRDLLNAGQENFSLENRLIQADMRSLPFKRRFDFVFSFFSSFGYFLSDRENIAVLEQMCGVLKPRGGFLIDFLNPIVTKKRLVPEDTKIYTDFSLTQRRWIDKTHNTVEKELIIEDGEGTRRLRERVKLYDVDDFKRFCNGVGLRITRVLGNYRGAAYQNESDRMIIIGERS